LLSQIAETLNAEANDGDEDGDDESDEAAEEKAKPAKSGASKRKGSK
jgi:hypothetical protein